MSPGDGQGQLTGTIRKPPDTTGDPEQSGSSQKTPEGSRKFQAYYGAGTFRTYYGHRNTPVAASEETTSNSKAI